MSPGSKKKKQKSYAVERILDVREMEDGKKEYKIKWEGYPEEEASWVHEEKMDCPKLVAAFNKRIGQPLAPVKTKMMSSSDSSSNSVDEGDRRMKAGGESAKCQNDEKTKEKKNETEEEMGEVIMADGESNSDLPPRAPQERSAVAELSQQLISDLAPLLMEHLEAERPPTFERPGLKAQGLVLFNIMKKLRPLARHADASVSTPVKEALKIAKERLDDLKVADTHPDGFRAVEQVNLVRSLAPGADPSALLLASSLAVGSSATSRKRRLPPHPFPAGGDGFRQPVQQAPHDVSTIRSLVRDEMFNASHRDEMFHSNPRPSAFRNSRPYAARESTVCYNCRQPGHWAKECGVPRRK